MLVPEVPLCHVMLSRKQGGTRSGGKGGWGERGMICNIGEHKGGAARGLEGGGGIEGEDERGGGGAV